MSPRSRPTGSTSPKSWPRKTGTKRSRSIATSSSVRTWSSDRTRGPRAPMARPIPVCLSAPNRTPCFRTCSRRSTRFPADIYVAPAPARLERETLVDETIRVGTAAEGATIKEGSYLVVKDRLAQIIDGAPSPFRSATARARTAYRRGMRASSGASSKFATLFVPSCAPRKPISPGAGRRSGCARLTRISSGSSARST